MPRGAPGLHLPRGDGSVVKHAETLAPRRAGVVRAPGETRRNAILDCRRSRIDGRPRAPQRPFDERLAPREADPSLLVPRERARKDPTDVAAVVHSEQFLVGGGMRFHELKRRPCRRMGLEPAAKQAVFRSRKAMPLGQR